MLHASYLLALALSAFASAATTEVRGRVFYDKLDTKEPSFFYHAVDSEKDGKRQVVTTYTDKQGKEIVVEENNFEGGKLVSSFYKQNQVNEHGQVTFKDGKVLFSFTDEKGTETDSEELVPDMILGSMIGDHLIKHWKELMQGDEVKVRYMAVERCESIGFKFFKDKERTVDGKVLVDFQMKPSSFFISAIVDPIRFTATMDEPHQIIEVQGRTPIRWPKTQPPKYRSDWKAIDARVEMDTVQLQAAPLTGKPTAPAKSRQKK